jgi:hypothetical protein
MLKSLQLKQISYIGSISRYFINDYKRLTFFTFVITMCAVGISANYSLIVNTLPFPGVKSNKTQQFQFIFASLALTDV